LKSAYANIPDQKKTYKGGEDAWICTDQLVGVADGVGGWNNRGVDPGLFSRELSWHVLAKYHIDTVFHNKRRFKVDLTDLLCDAVKKTESPGTSTFVLALLDDEDPYLRGLNFGDSGYLLIRRNELGEPTKVFRSEERQYRFNAPWQCGTGKPLPTNADVMLHRVQHNDVLVLATDGVLDNATDKDILNCIKPKSDGSINPQSAA
jgi:protein phosphatase PTC7